METKVKCDEILHICNVFVQFLLHKCAFFIVYLSIIGI